MLLYIYYGKVAVENDLSDLIFHFRFLAVAAVQRENFDGAHSTSRYGSLNYGSLNDRFNWWKKLCWALPWWLF